MSDKFRLSRTTAGLAIAAAIGIAPMVLGASGWTAGAAWAQASGGQGNQGGQGQGDKGSQSGQGNQGGQG